MRVTRFCDGPPAIREAVRKAAPTLVAKWREMLEAGATDRVGFIVDTPDAADWLVGVADRAGFAENLRSHGVPDAALALMAEMPGDREHAWLVIFTVHGVATMRMRADNVRSGVAN